MAPNTSGKAVPLERLTQLLGVPLHALQGQSAPDLTLPGNIVCFYHNKFKQMNQPAEGRAVHHRYVLMLALETAATVCVDDREIRLSAGEGLLVLPFQMHNYIHPEQDGIMWLFVTFEMSDGRALESVRFHSFTLSPVLRQLTTELLKAYLSPGQAELTTLFLALLLSRIRQSDLLRHGPQPIKSVSSLVIQINQLAQGPGRMPSVDEMASRIGISPSHLRARFRASCGVSLGRHLRNLRMEKACGLLRLSSRRVSEVAEQCGFNSIFSFSRAFRKTFSMSPVAYRRKGDRSGS